MLTATQLPRFRKKLLAWFAEFQRDLPWRRTSDPYRIWLSEIMLQQTRVAAAIPYFERFLGRFPDVESLATAPSEEVLRLWAGLGYYSRARNLQKAAQQIVATHNGQFPAAKEAALALPGIGAYTAAAILSIAYQKNLAVLDGNVARVIARLDAMRGDLRANPAWRKLQKLADHLLDENSPGDWNQAMMELGATLCTPHAPKCLLCPVSEFCAARKKGLVGVIPEKRKKSATVKITLAALVMLDSRGRTLLLPPPKARKKSVNPADVHTLVSGMWHFPAIPVANDPRKDLELLLKKLHPSVRTHSGDWVPLKAFRHAVTFRSITVLPYLLKLKTLPRFSSAQAFPLSHLSSVPISNLTRKVARAALAAI